MIDLVATMGGPFRFLLDERRDNCLFFPRRDPLGRPYAIQKYRFDVVTGFTRSGTVLVWNASGGRFDGLIEVLDNGFDVLEPD